MRYDLATLFVRCDAKGACAMLRFPKGAKVRHTPTWTRFRSLEFVLHQWAKADIAIIILPPRAA